MRQDSIQRKVLVILYSIIILFIITVFLFQEIFLKKSYIQLEEKLALVQHNRTQNALERDSEYLDSLLLDWSLWDDTYYFAETGSQEYIESNLGIDTLNNISINMMMIFDRNGDLKWGNIYDFDDWASLYGSGFTEKDILIWELNFTEEELQTFEEEPQIKSGFLLTEIGLIKAHSRPILKSDGTGPPTGIMIIGKILNESYFTHMKEIVHGELAFHTKNGSDIKAVLQQMQEPLLKVTKNESLHIYSLIKGLIEGESFILETISDRSISNFGKEALRLFITTIILAALVFTLVFLYLISRTVLAPLKDITTYLQLYSQGLDNPYSLNITRKDEIGVLSRGIDHFIKELKKQATTDALTGLKNRHIMDTEIPGIWNILSRDNSVLSVMLIDIDYFKKYNDTYGHQAGDECLKELAQILLKSLNRNSDIAIRFGGEEFLIFLPATDSSGTVKVAERIQTKLAEAAIEHKSSHIGSFLTLSIGISTIIPSKDNNLDKLIEQADKALYQSKSKGRNCATLFDD